MRNLYKITKLGNLTPNSEFWTISIYGSIVSPYKVIAPNLKRGALVENLITKERRVIPLDRDIAIMK